MSQRKKPELFVMLDDVWEGLQPYLGEIFTTQKFRSVVEEHSPSVWTTLVERYGPGGRGSGNYYSPANILYNYLNDKARNALIVRRDFVPSESGWGTRIVMQWQIFDTVAPPASEEDKQFIEGKEERREHLFRERNPGLRKYLLEERMKVGLSCDICKETGDKLAPDIRHSLFEAHHNKEKFATPGVRAVEIKDMSLLCANCHRLIHRLVAVQGEWIVVEEAKSALGY